jgi:hypothetical protein
MKPTGSAKTKAPTGSARYPNVEFKDNTDYVQITFHKYIAPYSKETGQIAGGASMPAYNASVGSKLGTALFSVYLYMPEDLDGEYAGSWQETNMSTVAVGALNSFGKAAGGDFKESFSSSLQGTGQAIKNALTKGTAAAKAISELLSLGNFGSLTVNDVYSVTTGQLLNPNTEVLYKGPKMRNFTLNFKMAPRDEAECKEIRKIIHAFKFATLPEYGGAGDSNLSFVTLPQIIDVTYKQGNKDHPWVTQFKPSVITNFNVSYTPDGVWATLPNGAPVATTIKVTLQELKMVYANELNATGASY